MMHSGISQAREFDDPPGLREKTEYLLREWVNMFHSPAGGKDSTKAFSAFVNQVSSCEMLAFVLFVLWEIICKPIGGMVTKRIEIIS